MAGTKTGEIQESEEHYRALFSSNYSISLLIDPDTGRIADANNAAVRYYGFTRDQLLSMKISDLNRLPEEKVVKNLKRAKNEREKHFFSTHYIASGERRSVEIYSGPITVQGKPLFYSIIHDITDRKRAEQALLESEERYRTLIDQIPDYVIVHRNGIILYVNPSAAAQLGYTREKLIGKTIIPFITPEHHDLVKKMMTMRIAGEPIPPYEMTITGQDGRLHTVLVNGARIQYMGEPASLNVLTDITPIKEAAEAVRQANEVLEKRVAERTEALTKANVQMEEEITARKKAEVEISQSLAEKELLLREIHHRVKNNLQIIISLLNLQSRHIQDQNVLDAIQDSQNRVRAMALVHERIYRSHNIATINLKDYISYLVNQIFGFYNIPRDRIGVTITMEDYPADIDMTIPIGLIVNELVSNSIKHAFPDGRTGGISIGCTQPAPDTLQFVYRDDGVGIPEGFDWRDSESLGLRLVNSLVGQLDGTIEKGPGEGTMFIITLHRKPTGGKPT
jgi:PAS domain S-box-containing protein